MDVRPELQQGKVGPFEPQPVLQLTSGSSIRVSFQQLPQPSLSRDADPQTSNAVSFDPQTQSVSNPSMPSRRLPEEAVFTRVLVRCLRQWDKKIYVRAKVIIKECSRRLDAGESKVRYVDEMLTELHHTVGEKHWKSAKGFLEALRKNERQQFLWINPTL